ncbi:MAG: BadF/BadG/BcrA/BcrD ATPase family protein [Cyanobacteria bacterium P01_A01_bin.45]
MKHILGIDGGGTKTICVVMDEQRHILGRGEAGSSNYQIVGINTAKKSIESAMNQAVLTALKFPDNIIYNLKNKITINAISLGLAGVGRSRDIKVIKNIVRDLQTSNSLPIIWDVKPHNIIISHDALISLVGGIGDDLGIVVACGTGSIVFGKNQQGKTKRVGGWGNILGDEGSAYQIAVSGIKAVLKAYDGRGEKTYLTAAFKNHLGLESVEDLIEIVYQSGWSVKDIAALAVVVDNAAVNRDAIANRIIDNAVEELVKSVYVVVDELFQPGDNIEIVTTGSLWKCKCKIWDRFARSLDGMKIILPRFEPVYGAALLGLRSL